MSRPSLVIGLGELLWDLLPGGRQLGGAPTNVAMHAAQLGASGAIVSAIGDDPLGQDARLLLEQRGLDLSGLQVVRDRPTGTVGVTLDQHGVPSYTIHEDVAWDHLGLSRPLMNLAAEAGAVCFGTLAQRSKQTREAVRDFLDATPPGCVRVFDVNLRPPYIRVEPVRALLERASVLKLGLDELPVVCDLAGVAPGDDPAAAARALLERYHLTLVALTRGAQGSLLITPERTLERPGSPLQVADTVGAGDAFTAALTVGLLRRLPLERVHAGADRLASFVCTRRGATPELPEELRESLYDLTAEEDLFRPAPEELSTQAIDEDVLDLETLADLEAIELTAEAPVELELTTLDSNTNATESAAEAEAEAEPALAVQPLTNETEEEIPAQASELTPAVVAQDEAPSEPATGEEPESLPLPTDTHQPAPALDFAASEETAPEVEPALRSEVELGAAPQPQAVAEASHDAALEHAEPLPVYPAVPPGPRDGWRTLLVAADPDLRETVESVLTERSHRVSVAETGTLGWILFQQESFDCAVIGRDLDNMTGLELVRNMRLLPGWGQVRVLLMADGASAEAVEAAHASGAADVLTLPMAPSALRRRIEQLERSAAEIRTPPQPRPAAPQPSTAQPPAASSARPSAPADATMHPPTIVPTASPSPIDPTGLAKTLHPAMVVYEPPLDDQQLKRIAASGTASQQETAQLPHHPSLPPVTSDDPAGLTKTLHPAHVIYNPPPEEREANRIIASRERSSSASAPEARSTTAAPETVAPAAASPRAGNRPPTALPDDPAGLAKNLHPAQVERHLPPEDDDVNAALAAAHEEEAEPSAAAAADTTAAEDKQPSGSSNDVDATTAEDQLPDSLTEIAQGHLGQPSDTALEPLFTLGAEIAATEADAEAFPEPVLELVADAAARAEPDPVLPVDTDALPLQIGMSEEEAEAEAEVEEDSEVELEPAEEPEDLAEETAEEIAQDLLNALADGAVLVDAGGRVRLLNHLASALLPDLQLDEPLPGWAGRGAGSLIERAQRSSEPLHETLRRDGRVLQIFSATFPDGLVEDEPQVLLLIRETTAEALTGQELPRLERLSSVGALSSGVSYEMALLSTGILGLSDLLRSRKDLPAGARREVDLIFRDAHRARELSTRLLALTREEAGGGDVSAASEAVVGVLEHELQQAGVDVKMVLAALPPVTASALEIGQIALQILLHALGRLQAQQNPRIQVETARVCDDARLRLRHNGLPLSAGEREKLFDFDFDRSESETLTPAHRSPFGLHVARALVAERGGSIEVREDSDGRTVFDVRLPRATQTSRKAAPARVLLLNLDKSTAGRLRVALHDEADLTAEAVAHADASTANAPVARILQDARPEVVLADAADHLPDLVEALNAVPPAERPVLVLIRHDGATLPVAAPGLVLRRPLKSLRIRQVVAEAAAIARQRRES